MGESVCEPAFLDKNLAERKHGSRPFYGRLLLFPDKKGQGGQRVSFI
jgi:hypothetical protein